MGVFYRLLEECTSEAKMAPFFRVKRMKFVHISISCILICTFLREGVTESKVKFARPTREEVVSKNFSSFVGGLLNKYRPNSKVVTIVIPRNKSELVTQVTETLVKDLAKTYSVKSVDTYCCDFMEQWVYISPTNLHFNTKLEPISDTYIIPLSPSRKLDHFKTQLMHLERDFTFNHKAKFILLQVLTNCEKQSSKQIVNIFNTLWFRNLFDSLLITCYACDGTVSVISARSFSSENVCRQAQNYDVKYFELSANAVSSALLDLSYEKPKDFNGCHFWAGTTPSAPFVLGNRVIKEDGVHYNYHHGIDIELMRLASLKLNFTYDFYPTISDGFESWFIQLPNRTILGILQDALEKKIDVIFGGVVPSYITYYKYDYTPSYKFSSICWYTPGGNEISSWKILFLVYPLKVWLLSAIIFIVVTTLYSTMSSVLADSMVKHFNLIKKYSSKLVLHFFSIGLGFSSPLTPKRIFLRILLLFWIIYSMNWTIIYQTVLFTLLTHPQMEKEMNSFQDIKDSGLPVVASRLYIDLFRYFESGRLTNYIMANTIICENLTACHDDFVHYRNFSIMEKIEIMEYLVNLKVSKIHRVEEKVVSYCVSFLFNKGNPLTEEFSMILLQTFQAGFLQYWEEVIGRYSHDLTSPDIPSDDDSVPLNLQDLAGALTLLTVGLSASLLGFIAEVLFSRFNKTSG